MKKKEAFESYQINKLDNDTVFVNSKEFSFAYTKADPVVKDEYKGKYRYFGGLQSGYDKSSDEYRNLEAWLCDLCEIILKF